jgi:two-component sensor histidine kinase
MSHPPKTALHRDAAIERGEQFLASQPDELQPFIEEYRKLLESYQRLVNKLNKVMTISDAYHAQSRESERQLSVALDHNRTLLREVNHRVKNNLAVVVSLLHLQSSQVKDPRDADLFREAEQRVKVMTKIHELLYRSITLNEVSAGEFFTSIAGQLIRSYCRPEIALQVQCGDLNLDLETVIPCGLIVNELVSNALKYAFPGDMRGTIEIGLVRDDADFLVLTVRDDGIGLPDGFDPQQSESLGLVLVTSLAVQLQGKLVTTRDGGTGFVIRFPAAL